MSAHVLLILLNELRKKRLNARLAKSVSTQRCYGCQLCKPLVVYR